MQDSDSLPVIVIAASAGGVYALETLVGSLPQDLPAAVFITLHLNPDRISTLPELLSRRTTLPVAHPRDGEEIRSGHIYCAPPDLHMLVEAKCVRLTDSVREGHQRPAADPLFRSAAEAFGPRVIGIVLSGGGSDGSRGVVAIKAHGGRTLAQKPSDASVGFMPANAVATGCIDRCLPLEDIVIALQDACFGGSRPESQAPPLLSHSVLVAEDEYVLASEIRGMLEKLGCQVLGPVSTAVDGLKLLRDSKRSIDCALLDVNLGDAPVYPLAQALRNAGIPVIFATGYGQDALPPEWRETTRLQKPFDARALRVALTHAKAVAPTEPELQKFAHGINEAEEEMRESRNQRMTARAKLTGPRGRQVPAAPRGSQK